MALLTGEMTSAAFAYLSAVHLLTATRQPIPPEIQIKTAQTLPILGKAAEAEASLRQLLSQPISTQNETAAAATLTWLLWRDAKEEAATWLNRARKLAVGRPNDPYAIGITALLTEWEGNLEGALEVYQALEQPPGIILVNTYLGDRFLNAGDFDRAREHYQQALKTAEASNESEQIGLALALYRHAELDWLTGNSDKAIEGLNKAPVHLPAQLTAERHTIAHALTLIQSNNAAVWPPWPQRSYDDPFRISLLFNSNSGTSIPDQS